MSSMTAVRLAEIEDRWAVGDDEHADSDIEALLTEIAALRHDIARHVQIASDQAEEIDRLRGLELERLAVLKHLQALGQECDNG